MKRMERLERAVGEIQRRLSDLGYPTPLEINLMDLHDYNDDAMLGDEMAGVFHLPPVHANGEESEL